MIIASPDKMRTDELIATVLGKGASDEECRFMALHLFNDEEINTIDPTLIAREYGPAAAKRYERVTAAVELGRRKLTRTSTAKPMLLARAEDVRDLMSPIYAEQEKEIFYCLSLNMKNYLKRMTEISIGSLNASIVHPREVYTMAVRISAASVIIVHNHPSGDPTPSGADIQLTRRLAKAGDALGIELLDHIVIGGGGPEYVSLRDQGLI